MVHCGYRADGRAGRQRAARRQPEDADVANPLTCVLFALSREAMFFRRALSSRQVLRGRACPGWLARVENRRVLVLITGMGAAATERARSRGPGRREPSGTARFRHCRGLLRRPGRWRPGRRLDPAHGSRRRGPFRRGSQNRVGLRLRGCSAFLRNAAKRRRLSGEPRSDRPSGHGCRAGPHTGGAPGASSTLRRCGGGHGIGNGGPSLSGSRNPLYLPAPVSDDGSAPLSPALSSALLGERVNILRLLGAVLRQPFLAVELMRLARQSRMASEALAEGLLPMLGSRTF